MKTEELAILASYAATLQRADDEKDSAYVAHQLGLIELVTATDSHGFERAIALLREATSGLNPSEAALADLATALLALYGENGELRVLLEAVEHTAQLVLSRQNDGRMCWNYSVALAWLGARDQLATAMRDCATHCRKPQCAMPIIVDDAPDAATDAQSIVRDGRWSSQSWEYATSTLLPGWARSQRTGDSIQAGRQWLELGEIANQLASSGADSTVLETLSALAPEPRDERRRSNLSRALELYGEARAAKPTLSLSLHNALEDSILAYTLPSDPVRDWIELSSAGRALVDRRLEVALASYRGTGESRAQRSKIIEGRRAFGVAMTTMALGDQVNALNQFESIAQACVPVQHSSCSLSAFVMASRVASLVGDEERAERLAQRALEVSNEPLSQWRWSLLSALRRIAEGYRFQMTTNVLQQEVAFTAAALTRPDLEFQDLLQHASDMARFGDTLRLKQDLDRLSAIYASDLSPEDREFHRPDVEWIRGAYYVATGRSGARELLDSSIAHLRSETNFARQLRPRMTHARALAFEGDTARALRVLDSLLIALNTRSTVSSTLYERTHLADNTAIIGATAAAYLRDGSNSAATYRALSGKPFGNARWPARSDDSLRIDLAIRRLGDSVHVWSRVRTSWQWRVVRLPASDVQQAIRSLDTVRLGELYDAIVAPTLLEEHNGALHLRIDARGDLASVPWSALYDRRTGRYLIERVAVLITDNVLREATTPTALRDASLLIVDAAPRTGRRVLPGALDEVRSLQRLWSSEVRVHDASKGVASVSEELSRASIVHFAGHAVLDAQRPERSYLEIPSTAPSRMTGVELSRLQLNQTALVVLAACDTRAGAAFAAGAPGIAGTTRGSLSAGLESLASAFREAGAQQVVGAAWPIDDAATAVFMQHFYSALQTRGNAVSALQQAQLESLRSDDPMLRSPQVWAAFQLLGS